MILFYNNIMKTFIYTLSDPYTNEVRYVGKSNNPKVRYRKHINESKNNRYNNYKVNWIKSLLIKNLKPILHIIDETESDWVILEEYWISQFITWGFKLVNGTSGGENPPSFKGKKLSDEHKKKLKDGSKLFFEKLENGLPYEWRNNISTAHKKNGFIPINASESNKIKISQFTLNGDFIKTWESITEAAKNVGLKSHSGIIEVCKNNRFKAGNFRWSFNNFLEQFKPKTLEVAQISLENEIIKIWTSIGEASKN